MKPQIHAAQKHAWIDGAIIEYRVYKTEEWARCPGNNPLWKEEHEYRASIAEVEGKPVFEGDVIYGFLGLPIPATPYISWNHKPDPDEYALSWNQPKPKTITVELLREDAEWLSNSSCAERISHACERALK